MLKPSTFVNHCMAEGFSPPEAMMLYDELRRFAFHSVEGVGLSDPNRAVFEHMRQFALSGLDQVETPKDFKDYLKRWDKYDTRQVDKMTPDIQNELLIHLGRSDFLDRASGMISIRMPEKWQDWRDLGLDWDDVRTAISYDTPALSASAPAGVSQELAQEKLRGAIEQARLGSFSWPFALENTPENVWALAADLEQCCQELGEATGWGPSALGLGQRIHVGFGMDRSGVSGVCHTREDGRSHIETSPAAHWGPLAHEWLHAVDNAINDAPIPSVSKKVQEDMARAWQAMHQGLDRAAWEIEQKEQVRACLAVTLVKQWENMPSTKTAVLDAFSAAELDEKAFLEKFQAAYGQENPSYEKSLLPIKAVTALVDVKMSRSNLEAPSSLWTTYATRFREEANVHLSKKEAKDWAEYFLNPMERAAHSFEATFVQTSLVSDVQPNQSMRYPITPELSQHQLVWKRFFRAAKPWKQQVDVGVSAPSSPASAPAPLSLAARRNLRLGDSGPSTPPSLPAGFSV